MFGQRENERKMRERWGCEDLFKKKNKSSNGSLFEAFQNREMHVVFKHHEPWTMRNRKEQFITRSAKRIEVIPGIRKKMVKWVSRFSSATPLSGTPSLFFFPQIRKSRTCSPLPSFFSFSFFFCSCLLQQASRCLLPSAALLCPSPSPISRLKKKKKTKKQRNSPLLRSLRGGLQICPSSVEFTSARNMNTGMKRKCE